MKNSSITESNKEKLYLTEELQHLKEFIDAGKTYQIKELCQQNPGVVNAEIKIPTNLGDNILISPLSYAILNETNNTLEAVTETVRALIDCGANPQQESRVDSIYNEPCTPLAYALEYAFTKPENISIVKLLISSPGGKEALKSFEENHSWTCDQYLTKLLEYQEQKEEFLTLFLKLLSKKSLINFIYMKLIELSISPEHHELMIQLHDNIFNKKSTLNQNCIQKLYNKDSNDNCFIVLQNHVDEAKYIIYRTRLAMGIDQYLSASDQTQSIDNNAIILHLLFEKAKHLKVGETNWQGLYNQIYPIIKDGRKLNIDDITDMLQMIPNKNLKDSIYFYDYLNKCLKCNLRNQYTRDEPYFVAKSLMHKIPDLAKIIITNPKVIKTLSDTFDITREDITLPSFHNSENGNENMLEGPPEEKHSEQINITTNIAEEQIYQNLNYSGNTLLVSSGCDWYCSWL